MKATGVQELSARDAAALLIEDWVDLWRRCLNVTPFQLPHWILSWARQFASDAMIVAIRHEQRLAGVVPLFVWRDPDSGERALLLLGTGITDYNDAIFAPDEARFCERSFGEWLTGNAHRFDRCDLQELRGDSCLLRMTLQNLNDSVEPQSPAPVLRLLPDSPQPLANVPHRELRKLGYYERRLGREKSFSIESVREHPDRMGEMLDALFRLHAKRWESRGERGVLASAAIQQFHREAAAGFLSMGVLRMYAVRIDGEIAAVFYGFADSRRTYYYLSGYDPSLEKLNLGTLIIGHALREAAREHKREFDFLRGAEAYKYHWGATDNTNYRRVIRPLDARAALSQVGHHG